MREVSWKKIQLISICKDLWGGTIQVKFNTTYVVMQCSYYIFWIHCVWGYVNYQLKCYRFSKGVHVAISHSLLIFPKGVHTITQWSTHPVTMSSTIQNGVFHLYIFVSISCLLYTYLKYIYPQSVYVCHWRPLRSFPINSGCFLKINNIGEGEKNSWERSMTLDFSGEGGEKNRHSHFFGTLWGGTIQVKFINSIQ